MNSGPGEPWRGPGKPTQNPGNLDVNGQPQGRPFGSFGPAGSQQLPSVLPPPPSYHQHHSQPSGSHSLSIADLTQASPQASHQYNTQPPPPNQGHPIGGIGHPMPHQSPQYMNRERDLRELREREMRDHELREREIREQRNLEIQRHQEEIMLREQREAREREREQLERIHREQQQQQQRPVQSHAGSMPIHQPVPSKVQNSIHGPNGLLSNGGSGPGPAQQTIPSSSNTAGGMFGMHQPPPEPARQQFGHQSVGPPQPQPGQPFMGGPSPMLGQAQLAHGQQPILNDALSYLDQVKVRFSDHPDVYNRFLDIMKDFKSQAIDTPGVIERVSNLFNGHPALIQGFNTFLPPGYRIECGTEENPDAIRVTTPSGTMTQSLQSRGRGPFEPAGFMPMNQAGMGRQDAFEARHGWGQPLGQQISPGVRSATLTAYEQPGQSSAAERASEQESTSAMHQQEQRGVSQLQNAVTAATNGASRPAMAVSPGPGQQAMFPQQPIAGQAGDPKRGPVEFNHAISYVNKIKNRFAQQPEIYKQFLEILQTYQRESKPIQDVYGQVTHLFSSAPDLLEDFKQFLPETAASHKAQTAARPPAADEMAIPTSNLRGGDGGYGTSGQIAQAQTPRPAAKMPPMGQFDPPSTSKENKKRRGAPGITGSITTVPQPTLDAGTVTGTQVNRPGVVHVGNASKRQKVTAQRQTQPEGPIVSPTLIPQLPEPLPPLPTLPTTQDEMGFFERAKKHIGNRTSYSEFLRIVNLYAQDIIDKYTLMDRMVAFIGNNADLISWMSSFLGIEEQDDTMEARIRPDPGRVNLAHCRSLGPSYRHLPKRDQNKTCKGRDGMCYEVLNDIWASHPTWASEDSGFVAHRKNQYEEALHRVEEERHDYDFHIESCQRTIQLMDPIVQQINAMNDADRANFVLAPGLGGASEAIPKRIIMKIYGREAGGRIMVDMFQRPIAVLPIVLRRLKQKLEEWKQVQREWEKVWREQIHKQFWKSLDHQGINAKNLDKKNFQQKSIMSEIQAKYEEQKKNREAGFPQPKNQLKFEFQSEEVIRDAAKLVLVGLETDRNTYNVQDLAMIKNFFTDFLPKFFSMEVSSFANLSSDERDQPRSNDELDDDHSSDNPSAQRNRHIRRGSVLRRSVLDRMNVREDSVMSGSKESTPVFAASDAEFEHEALPDIEPIDAPRRGWIKHAPTSKQSVRPVAVDEAYPHTTFNLYANATVYQFFRLFEMLYSRLLAIKLNEWDVHEAVYRFKGEGGLQKPAIELGMTDKGPEDFFLNTDPEANYYAQILLMCEQVLGGVLEMSHLEDTLRRYYNATGWQLYTVDKLVAAIIRCMWGVLSSDSKDKSLDITNLFFRDRDKQDTTRAQEIQYRKQVEKFSKDGEVYRISYTPTERICTVRLFPPEDATFDNDQLSDEAAWQYYVASYTMTDPTEGVDRSRMRHPFLTRSVPAQKANIEAAYDEVYGQLYHQDDQIASISLDTYKLFLDNDWIFYRKNSSKKDYTFGKFQENESFVEKFVRNTKWMKDQRAEDVERRKAAWEKGVKEGMNGLEERVSEGTR